MRNYKNCWFIINDKMTLTKATLKVHFMSHTYFLNLSHDYFMPLIGTIHLRMR